MPPPFHHEFMLWMSFSCRRGQAPSSLSPHAAPRRPGRPSERWRHGDSAALAALLAKQAPRFPVPEAAPESVVQSMRFEPALHFQVELGPRFCVRVESLRRTPLYVVGGRDCWLQVGREPALHLRHGDVVFLPRGDAHRVFSDPGLPASSLDELLTHSAGAAGAERHAPAGGDHSVWSGGFYRSVELAAHPLVASLPSVLHLRAADAAPWLRAMADAVRWMADRRAGGNGVGVTELLGALMQHAVLAWLRRPEAGMPIAGASGPDLSDARLLTALEAIHARPADPWTLESLAALCHMSRTAFATRFRAQMNLSPMQYLARWRIHLASRLLRERRLTLQQAADAVGYSTGAILARAYKRELGTWPSQAV
jgi:AraC-like DNA-binding protein